MKTLSVDKYQRIRLPDAKGGQKFVYENNGQGVRILTEVKPSATAPIKGRLVKRGKQLFGTTDQPIDMEALKQALAEFP